MRQSYDVGTAPAPGHLPDHARLEAGRGDRHQARDHLSRKCRARARLGVVALCAIRRGDGAARAILPGDELTNRRTGATSALASSFLSRPDSRTLLVVGSGHVAFHAAEAHCAVRPIDRVLVYGRTIEKADAFTAKLAGRLGAGREVKRITDLPAAAKTRISSLAAPPRARRSSSRPCAAGDPYRPCRRLHAADARER